MPPRKKARLSQAPSPKTPSPAPSSPDDALLADPWTDEEEIGLFKALMRWKPTGIHKHFRLMQVHAWLVEHRYIHPSNEHTRPPGIWRKLEALYDLPALDAREDARQLGKVGRDERGVVEDADVYSEAENLIDEEEFTLPADADDEDGYAFEEEMWRRRLPTKPDEADEDGESEAELPELNLAEEVPARFFMPSFSIEPDDAAAPKGRKNAKGGGSETKAGAKTRRRARAAGEDDEGDEEENGEGEGEREDNDGEEDAEESEEASQASTPAPRSKRAAKGNRGKTAAKAKSRSRKR